MNKCENAVGEGESNTNKFEYVWDVSLYNEVQTGFEYAWGEGILYGGDPSRGQNN